MTASRVSLPVPAPPPSAIIIPPAGPPEPASSPDSHREGDKFCAALQMPFPKTSNLSCFACSFLPHYLLCGGRPFVSGEKRRFTASFKPNLSFLMNVLMGGCSERVKEWLNREPVGVSDRFVRSNDVLLWVIGQIIFHR